MERYRRLAYYLTPANLVRAVRHPAAACRGLRHTRGASVDLLARVTGAPPEQVRQWVHDLHRGAFLERVMRDSQGLDRNCGLRMAGLEWLYVTVRRLRPAVVLETGVSAGRSSAVILRALADNGTGELHSLDVRSHDETGPVGRAVPEGLRGRWSFHVGPPGEGLPAVLDRLPAVDLFLHDSDHSEANMTWELETVWPRLRPGGMVLADDVNRHDAFRRFCGRAGAEAVFDAHACLGIARKPDR